jgi:HAD superfamily hydrolase (TIGR01549 family)
MKKYKAIIYDLDNTLLDTLKMNMIPLQKIIKEEKGIVMSYQEVLKFASYPGMKVMEELNIKDKERTYKRWVQYVNRQEAKIFDGVEDILKSVEDKGILQAVVTSKLKDQYQKDFVEKGLDKYMSFVILGEDTTLHKPHPEPLHKCIEALHLQKDEVIYIGDAYSDQLACKNAGIDFAFASWSAVKKLDAKIVLDEVNDILKLC